MEESNASIIVDSITKEWLGTIGGLLAVLGVIAAPITSGDTALRSARLIVADFMHLEQKSIAKRLLICIPIFAVTIGILLYSQRDAAGFDMIWRYFAWCNQALSVFTLWAVTVFLVRAKKNYYITLFPALFMTAVCSTYICIAPEGLALSDYVSYIIGGLCTLVAAIGFVSWYRKQNSIVYEKYRKSIWLPVALLVYTTAMAVYFIPRNTEISDTEKYLTVGLSYMIIALLWIVLRKKEKAEERRERDLENKK